MKKLPPNISRLGLSLWLASATFGLAVNEKQGGWPWNLTLHGYHDQEVAEELGTGWFLNVGPTGIRAQITHEHPKYLTVKYVFKDSPAHDLIKIGDIIVGANGTKMNVAHTFGRHKGWEGPMLEMSELIEDSQGEDGKLELIVWPGGSRAAEKTVVVEIEAIGRFSETWPFDCPRSDKLMTDLCDFLIDNYKRNGNFETPRPHSHAAAVLALMASGESKHMKVVDEIMEGYHSKRYSSTAGGGFPIWGQVHDGIVMGEYYLLTNDRKLQPAMESLAECLTDSVWPTNGGFSHRPFAFIQRRMAGGGPKGYGSMGLPAGLGMLALSLFKEADLPYAEPAYQRIHQGFIDSVGDDGGIGYGFTEWDHAVIELESENSTPKPPEQGIGFECLEGMQGIGEYEISWPTKSDPRYRPTDWLSKEADTNRVFHKGGNQRLVVRTMGKDAPAKPYNHNGSMVHHHGRSGVGALAHRIGNRDDKSYGYLADHLATGSAKSGKFLLNGHASTHMHVLWGSLGAAMAHEKDFREYLEDIRWWMVMAQAHDGGFVVKPGRDYASTDHVYGTRTFPTGSAALILAVKDKRLRITGASGTDSAANESTTSKSRPARSMSGEKVAMLDSLLRKSLAELSHAGELKPMPIEITKAVAKVWFAAVEPDFKLTFRALKGDSKASFAFEELARQDHVILARLVARLRQSDPEAQAMAGIYLELEGDTETADVYYAKAGEKFAEKLGELFE